MRAFILSAVLAVASLGWLAVTPGTVRAEQRSDDGGAFSAQTIPVRWGWGRWRGGSHFYRGYGYYPYYGAWGGYGGYYGGYSPFYSSYYYSPGFYGGYGGFGYGYYPYSTYYYGGFRPRLGYWW